ncbi:hypothetical protein AMECASPLE_035980 [Ameca splendens]|uniref:Uncharacterized protein n=1 Tax=Ameca splendens TaxID=208324 RepID=A0ABV0ZVA9_9TELE
MGPIRMPLWTPHRTHGSSHLFFSRCLNVELKNNKNMAPSTFSILVPAAGFQSDFHVFGSNSPNVVASLNADALTPTCCCQCKLYTGGNMFLKLTHKKMFLELVVTSWMS